MYNTALEALQKTNQISSHISPESAAQIGMSEASSIENRPMDPVSPERQAALVPLHMSARAIEDTLKGSIARLASLELLSGEDHSTLSASPQHQSALMRLPEELLLEILSLAIPRSVTQLGNLSYNYRRSGTAYHNHEYFRYTLDTVVSRRFHTIAREAFFRTYIHDVRLIYGEVPHDDPQADAQKRCDITALRPHRAEIEHLRLQVLGFRLAALEIGVRDLPRRLAAFPGLRELELLVETLEHSSRVADDETLLWEEIEKWRGGMAAKRRVKLRVQFECHDRRVILEGTGERRVVDLTGHAK
ncbi:hypothetical protein LTR57_019068 [Friedmanniomyces endolithicus]|nr:hypothetical protein LTR01_003578 [Friedmanniomyces endolithicus]KAK0828081.1 hypothetical protein LTR73_005034 [Friedmanniomyces endolithicus]KAK0903704.1 hypothetical protein LTR57_019068 [Friedmanniomyces endolithicus]KAK1000219.1 hypothetical protein LTS01_005110 [Friedmanniomyces endolithicus]